MYESCSEHFALALTVSGILTFKVGFLQKVGQSLNTILITTSFDHKRKNLHKTPRQFRARSLRLKEKNI